MPIKVPDYVSSQSVPGAAPFENASPVAFGGAAARLAEQGFNQIEQTGLTALGNVARHNQAIEAEKERHRLADAVLGGATDYQEKLFQADNEIKFGKTDPATGQVTEAPATSADYYERWKAKATELRRDAVANAPDQAVAQVLDRGLAQQIERHGIAARHYSQTLFVNEQEAESDKRAAQALRLWQATPADMAQGTLDDYEAWLKTKTGVFGEKGVQQRLDKFNQNVLVTQAARLSGTAEGRQKLIEMDNAGQFDDVDPTRRAQIMSRIAAAETRSENANRHSEAAIKAARNDREIEIGTLINQRNLIEASRKLEFYADLRLLDSNDIEKWRKAIATPAYEKISDAPVKARVMLDVNSMNPRISEAQIKSYYESGALSLADATHALEKRSSVARAVTNQDRAEDVRRHAQAEQNLQSILHINPGTLNMMTNIEGDPRTRLYGQLLSELVSRSKAFAGTEDPIDVVEKMRTRIRDAFSSTDGFGLTPGEVDSLYPNHQELDKALRSNRIDRKTFDDAVRRQGDPRVNLPRLAPPATPEPVTQRKSRTYGNQ